MMTGIDSQTVRGEGRNTHGRRNISLRQSDSGQCDPVKYIERVVCMDDEFLADSVARRCCV